MSSVRRKVPVQLLKDFAGLGMKGEIVQVTPGRMRNALHVNNGAAYVVKGQPLRVTLKTKEQADSIRQAEQKRTEAAKLAQQQAADKAAREAEQNARETRFRKLTNLRFGGSSSDAQKAPASTGQNYFLVETALKMLPSVITVKVPTSTGALAYSTTELCNHLSTLTGTQIPSSLAQFAVRVARDNEQMSNYVDHVGKYRVEFAIPHGQTLKYQVVLAPAKPLPESVPQARPYGPLSENEKAAKTETKTETKKDDEKRKKFEWENELLENF